MNCIRKKWFEIFAVDLDVTVSSGYIIAIFHPSGSQVQVFPFCSNFVEILQLL